MLQASEATVRADHHYRTPAVVYLCRGIVYCECGSKMHATVWRLKNGKKHIYRCKENCGMKPIPMELVDKAAKDYLDEFLSAEMQLKIAAFLRNYKNHQADVQSGFEAARKKANRRETGSIRQSDEKHDVRRPCPGGNQRDQRPHDRDQRRDRNVGERGSTEGLHHGNDPGVAGFHQEGAGSAGGGAFDQENHRFPGE